ncbi:MAG: XdhC family protein [Anaerolineae bacterium]|nr:XdhC family protein [Anaerolineae bacterium]
MNEFLITSSAIKEALQQGETVALATVVRARGSTPRHSGARMVIWLDGRIIGTVGGGALEQRVVEDAQTVISEGKACLNTYVLSTKDEDSLGLCGGSLDVFIECFRPRPTLVLIGAGHITQVIAAMASHLDMEIIIVDDRKEFVSRELFPHASQIHLVQYDPELEVLQELPFSLNSEAYVVVATWGWDLPALAQILPMRPEYVALVSSRTKWREIERLLQAIGVAAELTAQVFAPAGLDLGAETPAEIALAILAEIMSVRNKAGTASLSETQKRSSAISTTE